MQFLTKIHQKLLIKNCIGVQFLMGTIFDRATFHIWCYVPLFFLCFSVVVEWCIVYITNNTMLINSVTCPTMYQLWSTVAYCVPTVFQLSKNTVAQSWDRVGTVILEYETIWRSRIWSKSKIAESNENLWQILSQSFHKWRNMLKFC